MLHSAGYGDPKLLHLSVDLQPGPPLSHSPCGDELPSCHTHANRPALFPQCGEARLQEELAELWRERARLVDDCPLEGCHSPSELLLPDVGADDELQVSKSLTVVSGPEKTLRELMTSKSTSEAYPSSGSYGGAFPSSPSVVFASTASAAADTVAWSLEGNLATSAFHFSSFHADRGSISRLHAATLTPPAWLHADDARSSFFSSEASWAASRCLQSPTPVNAISDGSRSTMSPLSINANFCRLLIRLSGEWRGLA